MCQGSSLEDPIKGMEGTLVSKLPTIKKLTILRSMLKFLIYLKYTTHI